MHAIDMDAIRQRLVRNAYLFDAPATYVAGVEDALAEVERMLAAPVIDLDRHGLGELPPTVPARG